VEIRDATPQDAHAACDVLRQSISKLCGADHGHDPAILERWPSSKTPKVVAESAAQPENSLLVAVEGDALLAVGSVTDGGDITLNYVAPDARFRGVSRALLRALETRAIERGNSSCTLISTETAHRFYLSSGYVDDGTPVRKFGTRAGYPMFKRLAGPDS
jgi:GNAT superfamily N-acetyltransferase